MSAPERVVIGDAELWWGQWEKVYDTFPKDAAIVSDPPYGMRWDTRSARFTGGNNTNRKRGDGRHIAVPIVGDDIAFDPAPWLGFREVILWGSNHFAQRLPIGTTLVWIKRNDTAFGSFLSDAELAWEKGGHGVYCFRGFGRARDSIGDQGCFLPLEHPTQKPLSLMRFCVKRTNGTVIDPFAGSFTTGVAALQLGRKFIGCEVEERYWQAGCKRVEAAYQQLALFPAPLPRAPVTQLALLAPERSTR